MPVSADRDRQAPVIIAASRGPARPVLWWARDFPGGTDQVHLARHWIEDLLPQCDPLADIALLASEACTNAILHTRSGKAGGRFTVDVEWAPQAARVVIGDQGSSTAPAITAKTQDATWADENGRGLWLVDELADDWGTAAHRGNRWVWIDMQWQARGGPPLQAPGGCEAAGAGLARGVPRHHDLVGPPDAGLVGGDFRRHRRRRPGQGPYPGRAVPEAGGRLPGFRRFA